MELVIYNVVASYKKPEEILVSQENPKRFCNYLQVVVFNDFN